MSFAEIVSSRADDYCAIDLLPIDWLLYVSYTEYNYITKMTNNINKLIFPINESLMIDNVFYSWCNDEILSACKDVILPHLSKTSIDNIHKHIIKTFVITAADYYATEPTERNNETMKNTIMKNMNNLFDHMHNYFEIIKEKYNIIRQLLTFDNNVEFIHININMLKIARDSLDDTIQQLDIYHELFGMLLAIFAGDECAEYIYMLYETVPTIKSSYNELNIAIDKACHYVGMYKSKLYVLVDYVDEYDLYFYDDERDTSTFGNKWGICRLIKEVTKDGEPSFVMIDWNPKKDNERTTYCEYGYENIYDDDSDESEDDNDSQQ